MLELTPKNVERLFVDCLFRPDEVTEEQIEKREPPKGAVIVDGLTCQVGLHGGRLEEHREKVKQLLTQLPEDFIRSKTGGMTFLGMVTTRGGEQWTGLHRDAENLLVLGIGLGLAGYCAPKELWEALPGGVPYVWIDTEGTDDTQGSEDQG